MRHPRTLKSGTAYFAPRCRACSPHVTHLSFQVLEDRLALTTLPLNFTETLITTNSNLSSPTAMEFSPTGQLWVIEQGSAPGAAVKLVRNDGSTFTAGTITVDFAGERGLLGIAFDPSYNGDGVNDFVYLYYTTPRTSPTDPSHNRISRFTVDASGTESPTLGGEVVLRNLPPENEDDNLATDSDTNHNGGALHIGPDLKLYAAVGDHNYDPSDSAQHVSQKTDTPFGKILRLELNGTNPTVDPNPFFTGSTSDWQGAIWAMGLRNPYTFSFEAGTGKMFINDVGEGQWEEINLGERGANYGWAGNGGTVYEGFEASTPWANYRNPVMAYDHSAGGVSPAGVAITGGVFYPANGVFGDTYAGKYFYADFGANFIRIFDPATPGTAGPSGTPDTSRAFASSFDTSSPVDLKVDAAGNLYYLARGGTREIYRITVAAKVDERQLFYNQSGTGAASSFDGNNAAINAADDNAIAADNVPLFPGQTATFANVSSYSKGINGVMVDIAGQHGTLTASDFIFRVGNNNSPTMWANAPTPTTMSVRVGAGVGGSDRIEFVWPAGAIQSTWLEVIARANANTRLAQGFALPTGQADIFFFGSAPGDSGEGNTGVNALVNATDEIAARNNSAFLPVPITNLYDYNRDRRVNATDQIIARNNQTIAGNALRFLMLTNPPMAPEASPSAALAGGGDDFDALTAALAQPSTKHTPTSESQATRTFQPVSDAPSSPSPTPPALAAEASLSVGLEVQGEIGELFALEGEGEGEGDLHLEVLLADLGL